jgi:drug/metabolite transporter (DMT)-like permease
VSNLAFAYAVGAGVSLATYVVGARLGAGGTHPVLGTAIVTGIAFVVNVALTLVASLAVVGLATASVNLCTLLAYASGLRVTSSFVIGGTSTVLVLLAGFLFLDEPFTWRKVVAVALVTAGTFLLQRADVVTTPR